MKSWMWASACAVTLSSLAPAALAQDAKALYVKSLAATCANCHGTDGRTVDGSTVPAIAGLPRVYMIEQMKAFKNGTRQATVMHQLAKGYTDEQIEMIADYFSALKR